MVLEMAELQIHYNRYDGAAIAVQMEPNLIQFEGGFCEDDAYINIPLEDNEDFGIHFKAINESVDPSLFDRAKQLMTIVGHVDNLVQESCAEACRKSGTHPRNYEAILGYVQFYPDRALLTHWGTGVNTSWRELVKLENGTWIYAGTVPAVVVRSDASI